MAGEGDAPLVRWVCFEDAAALVKILEDAPETVRWGPEQAANPMDNSVFLVGESRGEVVGFLLARHAADESEILNIAVRRSDRRSGVGSALLRRAVDHGRANGVRRVYLEVRESNATAIAFYEKHGFGLVGRRKRYYQNPDEDALLFEQKLTG
jgi:ribosomal-protein-alanine N-acetyltransferase